MIVSIISQGFVWAILGLGIFMTFRILNFPDMTTEGSFPLGGAVAVTLITQGVNPFLATLVAVGAGCLAGLATGLLYTKGKIPTLLSGILVMTSCHSIMLMIMGRANLGLLGTKQIQDVLPFSSEVNQLFTGLISLITWLIYKNNHIHPRLNYLFDALWMMGFGLYSISPFHDATNFELLLLGFYLIMLGASSLRDGFFFEKGRSNPKLKRRMRMTLPIFMTALIPISTLRRWNERLSTHQTEESEVHLERKNEKSVDLEIFIHTSESSFFLAMGHVDICYQGQVISYGSYDPHSERLFGAIGDGVLFKANREKYIELCKRESQKTLFAYGLSLSEQQKKAIEERLREIESLLIPWEPSSQLLKRREGEVKHTYSYQLKHEADATLYKFTSSKFKTYFVLSTNCVLLADSIVGEAGTDILSPQGFIVPGTYQDYLDLEFKKPSGIVVSRSIY